MRKWLIHCGVEMEKAYTESVDTWKKGRVEIWFCPVCKDVISIHRVPPNTAYTRLETGAANADSESNPAVSSA